MNRFVRHILIAAAFAATLATPGRAQLPRQSAAGGNGSSPERGRPRDSRFPYAGVWHGMRTMPVGQDEIQLHFSVDDGKYAGFLILPDGRPVPGNNLVANSGGITWELPNSGGGTWVYHVRLAGPDSLAGTLVLRDAPPNFNPAPRGTLILKRQPPAESRRK